MCRWKHHNDQSIQIEFVFSHTYQYTHFVFLIEYAPKIQPSSYFEQHINLKCKFAGFSLHFIQVFMQLTENNRFNKLCSFQIIHSSKRIY